jgi:hypothetical protein
MQQLTQFMGMCLVMSALSTPAFAHPEHGLSGGFIAAPEHFFSDMHYLLPVVTVGLVMVVLLRCWHGRSTHGTTFRDWLAGRRG